MLSDEKEQSNPNLESGNFDSILLKHLEIDVHHACFWLNGGQKPTRAEQEMERQPPPQTVTVTEILLKTSILALKILIPMLWLQSKLSPVQFLIGGTALILVAFLLDSSRLQNAGPSRRVHFDDSSILESSRRGTQ